MPKSANGTLAGGTAAENAGIIRSVLAGERGAPRDVVLINAGAALFVAGVAASVGEGMARAAEAIDSGAARERLDAMAFRPSWSRRA